MTYLLQSSALLMIGASGGAVTKQASASAAALMSGWAWWISLLSLIVMFWYFRGVRVRAKRGHKESGWRQAAFYSGVLLTQFAIEPPLDTMEDHLFAAHMLQHMLIRMPGPMLICLAAPMAILIAGLPRFLRRGVLRPAVRSKTMQRIWKVLVNPLYSAILWMGSFYIWMWPRFFDPTVIHESMDDLQHLTLFVTGLFFWWMAFDPRGKPGALRYEFRLLTVLLTLLPNIALGAYITFTTHNLYRVYAVTGRYWGVMPMLDQQIGGLIIWVPGSMMTVIGALIVLRRWVRDDASRPLSYQARRQRMLQKQHTL